jgi:hypothetical protein
MYLTVGSIHEESANWKKAGAAQIHAVDAHMDGLRRLVYMRGGLTLLDDLTISTIYWCVLV